MRLVSRIQCAALVFLSLLPAVVSAVELRDYVGIVEPVVGQETRAGFSSAADFFSSRGEIGWASFFRRTASGRGTTITGTGWVFVDPARGAFLVTNRHVVGQGESATVRFESIDGEIRSFESVGILYVDEVLDLALLELPPEAFTVGLPVLDIRQPDGTPVVAVGHPGYGGRPLWQYSVGYVSNAAARIDPTYRYLIQHTAPIDPGSSGGPLLVASAASPLGFAVVGVNTLKAVDRENTNFAIPALHVVEFLRTAFAHVDQARDPARLAAELEEEARRLARVLASPNPSRDELARYVSYAFVGTRGLQSYADVLSMAPNRNDWINGLTRSPVETLRSAISLRFRLDLQRMGNRSDVRFLRIRRADRAAIARGTDVRTEYFIDGREVEIVWTREHGHWRVKYAAAPPLVSLQALLETTR